MSEDLQIIHPAKIIYDVSTKYANPYYYNSNKNLPLVFCYDRIEQNLEFDTGNSSSNKMVKNIRNNCFFCFSDFFFFNEEVIKHEKNKLILNYSKGECIFVSSFTVEFLFGNIL